MLEGGYVGYGRKLEGIWVVIEEVLRRSFGQSESILPFHLAILCRAIVIS